MKKIYILITVILLLIVACAEDNPNEDLYDNSNTPNISSRPTIPYDFSYITDNGSANFNMAKRLESVIPTQRMNGVYFPHEPHRHYFNNLEYLNKDGVTYKPISGCATCHGGSPGQNRTFLKDNFTTNGYTVQGSDNITNPAHRFCWNTCHTQLVEYNNAPKTTECFNCHKVENIRANQ